MIEITASEVIAADVEDERMTCRNGCSKDGASTVDISLQPARSLRSLAKADSNGFSLISLPFLFLKPSRLARLCSPAPLSSAFVGSAILGPLGREDVSLLFEDWL